MVVIGLNRALLSENRNHRFRQSASRYTMNRRQHALGSGLAVAIAFYCAADGRQESASSNDARLTAAGVAGGFGALCGSLPDLIEPAVHPNHRQFFHSVMFAAILAGGLHHLNRWRPEEPWQRLIRCAGLIAGVAYLVHLVPCQTDTFASARSPWYVARRVPPGMAPPIAQGRNAATGHGERALRERAGRATAALPPWAIRAVFPADGALH